MNESKTMLDALMSWRPSSDEQGWKFQCHQTTSLGNHRYSRGREACTCWRNGSCFKGCTPPSGRFASQETTYPTDLRSAYLAVTLSIATPWAGTFAANLSPETITAPCFQRSRTCSFLPATPTESQLTLTSAG